MLGVSILIDVVWFILISQKWLWKSPEYQNLAPWETLPHKFATIMGITNFFIKVRYARSFFTIPRL